MTFIGEDFIERKARERAEWIDQTIINALPKWKRKILQKYPHAWLSHILNVYVEIINEQLIADFGTRVIIKLNGKVIGDRKFNI